MKERKRKSFWSTVPGIITAIASLLTAVAALITILYTTGVFTFANDPPLLNPIGDKTAVVEQLLQFNVSATDPGGDQLTFSASNLPGDATFDPQTRTFSWTPGPGQAKTYIGVHFEVTDGALTDSEDITITVIEHVSIASYQGEVNTSQSVFETTWLGQIFITGKENSRVTEVRLQLSRFGDIRGMARVGIKEMTEPIPSPVGGEEMPQLVPTGDLTFGELSIDSYNVATSPGWVTFPIREHILNGSTMYAIVLSFQGQDDSSKLRWHADSTADYTGGYALLTNNSGLTWKTFPPTYTFIFEALGKP